MTTYNNQLSQYITDLFAHEDQALRQVRENITSSGLPAINVTPEEGCFLQFLVHTCQANKALEIGTLGGYSAIWIARGLPAGGKLISLEVDAQRAKFALEQITMAGFDKQVEIRAGNALELLPQLVCEAPFDFIFIDADKPSFGKYFKWAYDNLRTNGMIAAHNAFRGGGVAQGNQSDETTRRIRDLNQRVAADPRLFSTIFPAGDGTLVAIKLG